MNFTLSEDEYNRLDAVREQMNLISGLLTAKGANLDAVDASNFLAFFDAQSNALKGIIKAVDARYELERDREAMNYTDMLYAIRLLSGDGAHTPWSANLQIIEKLTQAAAVDSNYQTVLAEYKKGVCRAMEAIAEKSFPLTAKNAPVEAKKPAKTTRAKLNAKMTEVV